MNATTKRIGSIATFFQRVKQIESREGYTLFYRGHANFSHSALPSIFRKIKNDGSESTYAEQEDNLFKNMITQCPQEFVSCSSTLEHLVKMQHYGLPTRLLDLTTNPLVALYFACCTDSGKGGTDGEVLVYEIPNNEIKFFSSDTVAVISNLAKMPRSFEYHNEVDKGRFLHEIQAEKPYFKDKIKESDLSSVQCVKAKLDNRRITQQSGAFFIFGMGSSIGKPAGIPHAYRCTRDGAQIKIEVAQNGKKMIIDELAELSITEASLFPEIDNVARFLKEQVVGLKQ